MNSSRIMLLAGCVLVTACDDVSEDNSPPPPIVLECTNDLDKGTEKEGWVSIVRAYPENPYQLALQYFHFEDGRWSQPCRERGSECSLSVTSRFIEEVEQRPGYRIITEINRSTGRINRTIHNDMPGLENTVLEDGSCKKTEEPAESETKF